MSKKAAAAIPGNSEFRGHKGGIPGTDVTAIAAHVPDWQAYLRHGADTSGVEEPGKRVLEVIEARLRTGRLLGSEEWIARQEALLARKLSPAKRGPKPGKVAGI